MRDLLEHICGGKDLQREQSEELFQQLLAGELSEIELSALLVALKAKGETPAEIAGAAAALRRAALPFDTGPIETADTCGTGGSGAHTVNISTAVALLAAEMGLSIVKHGNRSVSSKCGSADVLERCGVNIELSRRLSQRCLEQVRICFLFAPKYHPGLGRAMPVRRALGVRTILNILGPLCNPAAASWQIVGVYDPGLCEPVARTLGLLGCRAALVVHGSGLDEIAVQGSTEAVHLRQDGQVERLTIDPVQLGLRLWPLSELRGGGPDENASWLKEILGGGALESQRQAVALNTGALLWVSGRARDLATGTHEALGVLQSGAPLGRLDRWAELSLGA